MIYLLIILVKVIEVSLATIRIVLITKGERKIGSIVAFFEVTIWVLLASSVLESITEDPIKVVAYALGFAIGNYVGSLLEEKIGIGTNEIQVIVNEEHGDKIAKKLRDEGYAVTMMQGEGMMCAKSILITYIPRKSIKSCADMIKAEQSDAVITLSDKKPIYGGFGVIKK